MTSTVETSSSAIKTEKGTADVNGTSLYYELAGSGHPLVLIHGFSVDTRMWDDQFETFAQHYQVMRYDCRGYGKSALPTDDNYTHADDLAALIEHLTVLEFLSDIEENAPISVIPPSAEGEG